MAENPKMVMDQVVAEVVVSGRTSLHTDNPLAHLELTDTKSESLRLVLDLLHWPGEQVAHDNHKKYVLSRDGATSFVYLASAAAAAAGGGAINGLPVAAQ